MSQSTTQQKRVRRAVRTRARIAGNATRPRLSILRTAKHLSAQLIDDAAGHTLVSVSDKEVGASGTPVEQAKQIGLALAKKAAAAKITSVVFDRGAYRYHGRVAAFADGAREGGLEF